MLQTAWAELDRMLDEGIIEPSDNPWRSCPVLVPKTFDMFRFCIDYTGPQKKKKTVGSGMETILFFCIFSR